MDHRGRNAQPSWPTRLGRGAAPGKARCIAASKINGLIPTAYYQDRDYNGMDACSYSPNAQGI